MTGHNFNIYNGLDAYGVRHRHTGMTLCRSPVIPVTSGKILNYLHFATQHPCVRCITKRQMACVAASHELLRMRPLESAPGRPYRIIESRPAHPTNRSAFASPCQPAADDRDQARRYSACPVEEMAACFPRAPTAYRSIATGRCSMKRSGNRRYPQMGVGPH